MPALLLGLIGSIASRWPCPRSSRGGWPAEPNRRRGSGSTRPSSSAAPSRLFVVLLALAGLASWRRRPADRFAPGRSGDPVPAAAHRPVGDCPATGAVARHDLRARGADRAAVRSAAWPGSSARPCWSAGSSASRPSSAHATHLLTTADLYGAAWDYQLDLEDPDDAAVVLPKLIAGSRSDRGRHAVPAPGQRRRPRRPRPEGRSHRRPGGVHDRSRARSLPCSPRGRPPGPGEVVLGRRLGRRLGVTIGDTVDRQGLRRRRPARSSPAGSSTPARTTSTSASSWRGDTLQRFARA